MHVERIPGEVAQAQRKKRPVSRTEARGGVPRICDTRPAQGQGEHCTISPGDNESARGESSAPSRSLPLAGAARPDGTQRRRARPRSHLRDRTAA
jgi:hypothetical protein